MIRPMPRPRMKQIASMKDWGAWLSTVRQEVVEAMRLHGPCSIAEVAAATGRPADALYRHVKLLVDAGFLEERGIRKGKRNAERIYDAAADDFAPPRVSGATGKADRDVLVRTATTLARATLNSLRDSAAAGRLECTADRRNFAIQYDLTWLTPERYLELRSTLLRINELIAEGRANREGDLYSVFSIATPVTRRRGTHTVPATKDARAAKQRRPAKDARSPKDARSVKGTRAPKGGQGR